MYHNKKRKHNNFIYKPQKLNLNEREEKENKTNIHHWNAFETIQNTHGFNRSVLNVAYKHPVFRPIAYNHVACFVAVSSPRWWGATKDHLQ